MAPKIAVLLGFGLGWTTACAEQTLDASSPPGPGEPCAPGEQTPCGEGLACEPVADSDEFVCAARVEIRGQVVDALSDEVVVGAQVVAVDELGAPVSRVATTDVEGRYTLSVSVRRDADGEIADLQRWTLLVSAPDYLAFPGPTRPALPINAQDVVAADDEPAIAGVIDNASTVVALIPRPADAAGGVTVSGWVDGEGGAGTLVVAEGVEPVSLGVADLDGRFSLFNVPAGSATVRGYRQGLELSPAVVEVGDADVDDVRLSPADGAPMATGVVRGSVNIVNAGGGAATSVVLVPSVVFDEVQERGPVPAGLRAPAPPDAPSVTSSFQIEGVPAGRYHVLAAFENDALVRDPDTSIAGTQIQTIELSAGATVDLDEAFKVTEALAIVGPGVDAPEAVDAAPVLRWEDDSSEDRYEVVVRDALGEEVWRDDQVPGVSGGDVVEVPYAGPALTVGMYYQFRVTSWRDTPQGSTAISRSEDLRGVFVVR